MPSKPVVVNNTPLVGLWNLGRLDLLPALFESVIIPSGVQSEFLATQKGPRAEALRAAGVEIRKISNHLLAKSFVGLDLGESEVLALGQELEASLLVIDDLKARRFAERLGFKVTGTIGLLLAAKRQGHVTAVGPLLAELLSTGLHISPELIRRAKELAGE